MVPNNTTGSCFEGAEFLPNHLTPVLVEAMLQWLASQDGWLFFCVLVAGWFYCQIEVWTRLAMEIKQTLQHEAWTALWAPGDAADA